MSQYIRVRLGARIKHRDTTLWMWAVENKRSEPYRLLYREHNYLTITDGVETYEVFARDCERCNPEEASG